MSSTCFGVQSTTPQSTRARNHVGRCKGRSAWRGEAQGRPTTIRLRAASRSRCECTSCRSSTLVLPTPTHIDRTTLSSQHAAEAKQKATPQAEMSFHHWCGRGALCDDHAHRKLLGDVSTAVARVGTCRASQPSKWSRRQPPIATRACGGASMKVDNRPETAPHRIHQKDLMLPPLSYIVFRSQHHIDAGVHNAIDHRQSTRQVIPTASTLSSDGESMPRTTRVCAPQTDHFR